MRGQPLSWWVDDARRRHSRRKGNDTSFSCDLTSNGFLLTSEYIPGPSGEQLTELDGQGNWIHTNAYAGGQLIATYANDGKGVHFNIPDWLGTQRVQTIVSTLALVLLRALHKRLLMARSKRGNCPFSPVHGSAIGV